MDKWMNSKAFLVYEAFPRGSFDNILSHITDIMCFARKEGFVNLHSYAFGESYTGFEHRESVYNLLSIGINLMMDGAPDEYFFFILDLEFFRILRFKSDLSELELAELAVMKQSIIYLRLLEADKFYIFSNPLFSFDLGSKVNTLLSNVFHIFD